MFKKGCDLRLLSLLINLHIILIYQSFILPIKCKSKIKVRGEVQITVLVLSHQQSKVQRYSVYYHVRHRKAANLFFYCTTNQLIEGLRIDGVVRCTDFKAP